MYQEPLYRKRRWPWLALVVFAALLIGVMAFTAVTQAEPSGPNANLITGVVTDTDGNVPPANTYVYLISPPNETFGAAQVDGSGNFNLGPVPNGNYILQAQAPGSGFTPSLPYSLLMTGGPEDVGTLALTNPTLTGTVFAPDGTTPTTAQVVLFKSGYPIQSSTAVSGSIELGGLLTGTYGIQAFPIANDPYWRSPRQPITVTAGVSQSVDLTLQAAQVAGIVADPSNVPVPHAKTHVFGLTTLTYRQDETNGSGYFAIGDLPADTYLLLAEPPWNASGLIASQILTFTVPPDFTDMGIIKLRSAPKTLSGLVETNTGIPVENALVVANRLDEPGHRTTMTQADGAYLLRLSGGVWAVTVRHTDSSNPADWVNNQPPQWVQFDKNLVPESKTINFTVLTADSTVIGQINLPTTPMTVAVSLRSSAGIGQSTLADVNSGVFTLTVPHGAYKLLIHPQDPNYAGPPPRTIQSPISGTLDLGLIDLVMRDAAISGQVLDEAGDEVEGVQVVGWTQEHQGAQTWTSPDGSYALAVMAGEWLVKPHVPPELPYVYAGTAVSVTIASGQTITGTDFTLTAADNTVEGQLVDANGHLVNVRGWASASNADGPVKGAPITGGSFTLFLPDGSFQVRVHLSPDADWLAGNPQPVTVAGGETVTETFTLLPQDATLLGALYDPRADAPVTGVNGRAFAYNPFASVSDDINPANGVAQLNLSAGLWALGYGVDPASCYVAIDHQKVVPLQSGQTLGTKLPVLHRDGWITGTVTAPDSSPLAGAIVAADGIGDIIGQVTLRAETDENGVYRLPVPHGRYLVRAAYDSDQNWLNPVALTAVVPRNGAASNVDLQFRESDVTLTGTTSISTTAPLVDGRVHIWAFSADGAATKTVVPLGDTYTLNLISNTTWYIGAVLETGSSFYATRETVAMGSGNETLDLVLTGPHAKPGPVVVSFDAAEPMELALADGTQIYIPAGAMPVTGTVTLHITPIATFPNQHHARLYKYGYAFIATDETGTPITQNFNQNVFVRFSYDEAELARLGLRERYLKPAYYSTTTQSWTIPESYVVDADENLVTMQIDHFTDFSLLNSSFFEVFLPIVVR